jgi:hypothetical protein
VFREAVPAAFWEAVSVAEEKSSARIVSRIIAVWDVTTYVGIDAQKKEPVIRGGAQVAVRRWGSEDQEDDERRSH